MRRAACLALVVATVGVYLVMLFWSLPTLSAAAGGLIPFDLRPQGYGTEEARAFVAALSPEGRDFYLGVQHWLDLAYPALLAASLGVGFTWAWRDAPGWVLALCCALALGGMAFDYLENVRVRGMLVAGPERLTPEMVAWASRMSVLKAVFTTLAMCALLAGALRRAWIWRRN